MNPSSAAGSPKITVDADRALKTSSDANLICEGHHAISLASRINVVTLDEVDCILSIQFAIPNKLL